jgi:hypothetical protein
MNMSNNTGEPFTHSLTHSLFRNCLLNVIKRLKNCQVTFWMECSVSDKINEKKNLSNYN